MGWVLLQHEEGAVADERDEEIVRLLRQIASDVSTIRVIIVIWAILTVAAALFFYRAGT